VSFSGVGGCCRSRRWEPSFPSTAPSCSTSTGAHSRAQMPQPLPSARPPLPRKMNAPTKIGARATRALSPLARATARQAEAQRARLKHTFCSFRPRTGTSCSSGGAGADRFRVRLGARARRAVSGREARHLATSE
jgi:hypothetical protein